MKNLTSVLAFLVIAIPLKAATIYYVDGACGNNSWAGTQQACSSPNGPKLTIQSAIDTAATGDTIIIMPAIYYENITIQSKNITITSTNPDDTTIVDTTVIDGGGTGRPVTIINSNTSILGITVQNGNAVSRGGGVFSENSDVVIVKSTIQDNYAHGTGGGIFCYAGNITMKGCKVLDNIAVNHKGGGGLYGGGTESSLTNCTFEKNEVVIGDGGAVCSFDGLIKDCVIIDNHIVWEAKYGGGGLAYCTGTIIGCVISNNSVEWGNGGGAVECSGPITNCIITDNLAWSGIGDVPAVSGGGLAGCSGPVTNCVIANNVVHNSDDAVFESRGGGLANCTGPITNCTIANNLAVENIYGSSGGGLWSCTGPITNSIICQNTALVNAQIYSSGNPNYSCIQNWTGGGIGNITANPLFAAPGNNDYHLKSQYGRWDPVNQHWVYDTVTSLCIDAGDPVSDWTSELWPHGKRINMGAYGGTEEASMSCCMRGNIADVNNDGTVNLKDFVILLLQWCRGQARTIPHGTITVDSDLSDWAGHIEWIPLDKNYLGNPADVTEAKFAFRWNDQTNKIYVAVVVQDTDHVFADSYISWAASDRLEVFSQGDAAGGTGWWHPTNPTWDAAQQYMVAPDTVGGSWATWGNGWVIGPDLELEYAVRIDGDKIIYEVGIPQFDNYGQFSGGQTLPTDLKVGHVVAFDVIADTRHSAGFGMLSENMMIEKFKNADRFAHYILSGSIASPPHKPLSCDLDRNQVIDIRDLHIMADNWLTDGTPEPDITWICINDSGAGMKDTSGNPISQGGFTGKMSKFETTNAQYCQFLNAAKASGDIVITLDGTYVRGSNGSNPGADFVGEDYYYLAGSGSSFQGAINGGAARIRYICGSFTVECGFENHPVTYVSWYGANAFCNYYGWRLPTEWEWQAVADHDGTYNYGCGLMINNSIANYYLSTHPHGTTPMGAFGTYGYGMADMAGNVWEWTASPYNTHLRVVRGGSWGNDEYYCLVSSQYAIIPHHSSHFIGFRVCR